jgi:Ca2+-binding EF-hand superfamily protein
MSAITGGGTLTQQLYQRLFDRLNTNADDALSFDEMNGAGASNKAAEAFKALDSNSDGKVVRAEMTPSSAFSADTLNAMLLAQTDQRLKPMRKSSRIFSLGPTLTATEP